MNRTEIEERIKEVIEENTDNYGRCMESWMQKELTDLFIALSNDKKWIKLKTGNDVLPELKDDSVLARFDNGSIETVHIEDFFEDIKSHVDDEGNQVYTKWYFSTDITHWMPLPEHPSLH
jgi:hypothetical protein